MSSENSTVNKIAEGSNRVIDPIARISEILFGLIMVLTFTCTLSASESGHQEVRAMLVAAIGCNFAWGFVDAVMYLMSNLTERGRNLHLLHSLQETKNTQEAHQMIRDALRPIIASTLSPQELESMRNQLNRIQEPPRVHFKKEDWLGAVGVFLLVFLSTFPVIIPFFFIKNPLLALRVSNGIAIVMLFLAGYSLGRYSGSSPWKTGLWMVIGGVILVGITIALGG